jgi:hypothetical protein
MSNLTGWFKDNQALAIALITQALIFGGYIVSLEGRISTLEIRGSPHLTVIDTRLTSLEAKTTNNTERINRLVDEATRK